MSQLIDRAGKTKFPQFSGGFRARELREADFEQNRQPTHLMDCRKVTNSEEVLDVEPRATVSTGCRRK